MEVVAPMAETGSVSELVRRFDELQGSVKRSKPFVIGPRKLTYGELFDRVGRLTTLYANLGLEPGDRVVVASEDDLTVITLFMSLLRNGLTAVLLNPRVTPRELRTLVEAADAKALAIDADIIAGAGLAEAVRGDASVIEIGSDAPAAGRSVLAKVTSAFRSGDAGGSRHLALLEGLAPAERMPADVPDSTAAYILFTSGTTSRPKGVEITHRNLAAQMATFVRQYGFDEHTRLLNVLPLYHADGIIQGPVLAFTAGASVIRPFPFRVDRLPELLDTVYALRVTHFVTVPSVLTLAANLGEQYFDSFVTEDFRFVVSTAAHLDESLWAGFEERFRTQIVNVYGLTETVCESHYCGPDDSTRRIGTIGKPVDCEARIVDEEGRDVSVGEIGELVLRGDNVAKGYFKMPEETAAVLRDGWFYTGDLAQVDDEGFYRIVGRKKNVIICGGLNVYPEDVTSVLRQIPGVLDAVTFAMDDDVWGERVVSCVVPEPGRTVVEQEIVERFLEIASREILPREIHILDDLPRGPAGKVIIDELKEIVNGVRRDGGGGKDGGVAEKVYALAAQNFRSPVDDLSPDSNPENTEGWTSLAHIDFLLSLETEFAVTMTPRDIMSIKTMRDVTKVVEEKLAAP